MDNSETFDKLVRELNPLERRELLDKLTPETVIEAVPMVEFELEEKVDLENEYNELSFFNKILVVLKSFFSGKDKYQITESVLLKRLEREVLKDCNGAISLSRFELYEPFLDEIIELCEAIKFFKPYIEMATGANRDEFLTYLGSFKIPEIDNQLRLCTDFSFIEKKTGIINEFDLKKEVLSELEKTLGKVTGDLRKSMFVESRTIAVLGDLVRFNFKQIEKFFVVKNERDFKSCRFSDIDSSLEKLSNLLFSFKVPPDKKLLEALYLYSNNGVKLDESEELGNELEKFFTTAQKSLDDIRYFNQKVSLERILKIIKNSLDYQPKNIGGGEDWFKLYSSYWQKRAEDNYRVFFMEKNRQRIYRDIRMYLEKPELPTLKNYDGVFKVSCAFLESFFKTKFTMTMNDILKKIIKDGRFYKKSNRDEITEAYTTLIKVFHDLKKFIDPNYKSDNSDVEEIDEHVKTQPEEEAPKEVVSVSPVDTARSILDTAIDCFTKIINVVYGILYGKSGGKYDSLSNLAKLISLQSNDFIIDLNEMYEDINNFNKILQDIIALENSEIVEQI
ncbi:MAG: DUF5312 family protein [Spirochaetales bacterium]|nr:DUF5312 family protein [Spirochaetales bacterium]